MLRQTQSSRGRKNTPQGSPVRARSYPGAWPSCEQAAHGFLFRGEQIRGLGGVHFMYGDTQTWHQRVEE